MKILLLTLLVFTLVATSSGHILSFVFDPACATVAEVASLPVCAAAESEATEKLMKSIADPGRRQCCSITYVVECMRNALHKLCDHVDDSMLTKFTSKLRSKSCRTLADPLGLLVCLPDGLYEGVLIAGLIFLVALVSSIVKCLAKAVRAS